MFRDPLRPSLARRRQLRVGLGFQARAVDPPTPNTIKITHHKTGAIVWHPLEENTDAGPVKFYRDAEAVLARLGHLN
jgi:hypothetical protein